MIVVHLLLGILHTGWCFSQVLLNFSTKKKTRQAANHGPLSDRIDRLAAWRFSFWYWNWAVQVWIKIPCTQGRIQVHKTRISRDGSMWCSNIFLYSHVSGGTSASFASGLCWGWLGCVEKHKLNLVAFSPHKLPLSCRSWIKLHWVSPSCFRWHCVSKSEHYTKVVFTGRQQNFRNKDSNSMMTRVVKAKRLLCEKRLKG